MCLIALAWRRDPAQPLLMAANRDEQHARPTQPLHFWSDGPEICAGRDLQAGGTWLGATRRGRFAAITNFREAQLAPGERSRGKLVEDFLRGETSALDYAASVFAQAQRYSGFNLLLGQIDADLIYLSNRDPNGPRVLPPGDYGLSNGLLDADWPKLCTARDGLARLRSEAADDDAALFDLMAATGSFNDEQLPDTGIGLDLERLLSPRFIRSPSYGTRCTTLLRMGPTHAQLTERRFDPQGQISGENRLAFTVATEFSTPSGGP